MGEAPGQERKRTAEDAGESRGGAAVLERVPDELHAIERERWRGRMEALAQNRQDGLRIGFRSHRGRKGPAGPNGDRHGLEIAVTDRAQHDSRDRIDAGGVYANELPRSPKIDRQFVKGGATTVILSLLSESPMHGYELIRTIRERTEGIFEFGDGTIYPVLYALREKGLVRVESQVAGGGRLRKIYHLTPAGRAALKQHRSDWLTFAKGMTLALKHS